MSISSRLQDQQFDLVRLYRQEITRQRTALRNLIAAIRDDEARAFVAALEAVNREMIWRKAFLRVRRHRATAAVRQSFLGFWI
jgi:hypothetical protein